MSAQIRSYDPACAGQRRDLRISYAAGLDRAVQKQQWHSVEPNAGGPVIGGNGDVAKMDGLGSMH